jgi:ABC-type nickel/cobalt efflux system permease component RcnA
VIRRGASLAAAAILLGARASWAQGCAMCATGLGGVNDPLSRGMNISILFLMSMPFLLTASVGGWLWYSFWRSKQRRPSLRVLRPEREEMS